MNNEEKKDQPNRPEDMLTSNSMNEEEMKQLLLDLHNTVYWQAIKRFFDVRCVMIENALVSIDPFTHPTDMARNQGIRIGLMDLEKYIVDSEADREKKEKGQK